MVNMSTNNTLSAFGITWQEEPRAKNYEKPQEAPTVGSFARALRERRPESTVASSIRREPSTRHPGQRRGDEHDNIIVGYEQGTAIPYVAKRKGATRIMLRKGEIVGGGSHEETGVGAITEARRAKDDSVVDYHVLAAPFSHPTHVLKSLEQSHPVNAPEPAQRALQPRRPPPARYRDRDTLRRLEGEEHFPLEHPYRGDWEQVDDAQNIPASRFSPDDSNSPPTRTGLFRSVSTKVKSTFRRRPTIRKEVISGPTDFRDLDPRYPNGVDVHPEIQAISLAEAQRKFGKPAHPEVSAPFNLRRGVEDARYRSKLVGPLGEAATRDPNRLNARERPEQANKHHAKVHRANTVKTKKASEGCAALPPPLPARPRKIKVVGEEDRITELGDFIEAAQADSSSEEGVAVRELPDDGDYSILDIKPARPKRKPVPNKPVILSEHARVRRGAPELPSPAKVTSQRDWRMSDEYPSADDLFDEIENEIALLVSTGRGDASATGQAALHEGRPDRSLQGTLRRDQEDVDRELVIDTFIHDEHSSWIAIERPNSTEARATRNRFELAEHDDSGEDEAKDLMERLRRMRAGDVV